MNLLRVLNLVVVVLTLAGCTSVPGAANTVAPAAQPALTALNEIIAAYSQNNINRVESIIDPAMIGRTQLLESMRTSLNQEKQIQIELRNIETVNSNNLIVIRTGWEKRYLKLPSMNGAIAQGQSIFMMQLFNTQWKLAAQSGDNIFSQ